MKSWKIVAIILLLSCALIARIIARKSSRLRNERDWYLQNLHYDFSARVDSVILLNTRGQGYLLCRFTAGKINLSVEDSLDQHLERHRKLRLFERRPDGRIRVVSSRANRYVPGDSVTVNTARNEIMIFRKGRKLAQSNLDIALRVQYFSPFSSQSRNALRIYLEQIGHFRH